MHTNTFCKYRKNYAHRLACILFWLILAALGALSGVVTITTMIPTYKMSSCWGIIIGGGWCCRLVPMLAYGGKVDILGNRMWEGCCLVGIIAFLCFLDQYFNVATISIREWSANLRSQAHQPYLFHDVQLLGEACGCIQLRQLAQCIDVMLCLCWGAVSRKLMWKVQNTTSANKRSRTECP